MFTLANVLTRRASTSGTPRAARAARLLLVLFTLVGVSACGDATGLSRVDGTYTLRSVNNQLVPASNGSVTLQSGTMTLDSGDWEIDVRFSTDDHVDYGRYVRSGGSIEFESDIDGFLFDGALTNNNRTLQVEYDFGGSVGLVLLEFRK